MPSAASSELVRRLEAAHSAWSVGAAAAPAAESDAWAAGVGLFVALVARADQLSPGDVDRLLPDAVGLHEAVLEVLRLAASERGSHLEEIYERVRRCLQQVDRLLAAASSGVDSQESAAMPDTRTGLSNVDLKTYGYVRDARTQSALMCAYGLAAAAIVVVLVVRVLQVTTPASAARADTPQAVGGLVTLALVALAAGHQARECRRAVFETRRVHRQLLTLDRYLSPLPEFGQDLLRGVMVQRLFPRLLDDDNPMREDDEFPDIESLMVALSPMYRDARRASVRAARVAQVPGAASP